ncbi:hypothetical protein ZWY2020_051179 [Hordeum vulgare]|nr:hypothetical protein ZWY2020_051179 [Hordeum vulgare]
MATSEPACSCGCLRVTSLRPEPVVSSLRLATSASHPASTPRLSLLRHCNFPIRAALALPCPNKAAELLRHHARIHSAVPSPLCSPPETPVSQVAALASRTSRRSPRHNRLTGVIVPLRVPAPATVASPR